MSVSWAAADDFKWRPRYLQKTGRRTAITCEAVTGAIHLDGVIFFFFLGKKTERNGRNTKKTKNKQNQPSQSKKRDPFDCDGDRPQRRRTGLHRFHSFISFVSGFFLDQHSFDRCRFRRWRRFLSEYNKFIWVSIPYLRVWCVIFRLFRSLEFAWPFIYILISFILNWSVLAIEWIKINFLFQCSHCWIVFTLNSISAIFRRFRSFEFTINYILISFLLHWSVSSDFFSNQMDPNKLSFPMLFLLVSFYF